MNILSRFAVPALALIGIVLLALGLRQTPTTQSSPTSPETTQTSTRATASAATSGPGAAHVRTSSPAARPPASASASAGTASSSAPVADLDDTGVELTVPADPGPDGRAVMGAATRFMQAFARPGAGKEVSWWAKVKPLLTSQAALDYEGTDPAGVPFTKVTGQPMLVPMPADSPTDLVAMVAVPTDVGVYTVHVRTMAPYPVTRITPPGR